jgi:hypothetical protein
MTFAEIVPRLLEVEASSMPNAECRMPNAECRMRNAEGCQLQVAGFAASIDD